MVAERVRFGIKARLSLLVSLVIVVIVLGGGIYSYFSTRDVIQTAITKEALLIAESNAQSISTWFKSIEDELYLFTQFPAVKNLEWDQARALMADLLERRPEYGGILLADRYGQAVTVEGLSIDISSRDYFIEALATGRTAYSQPMVTQGTNVATIMLAAPVWGERGTEAVGVVAFSVTLDFLQQLVEAMSLDGHGYGWLINNAGVVVGHPDASYIGSGEITAQIAALQPIVQQMLAGKPGVDTYRLDKTRKLIAFAPVEQNGWSIAVEAGLSDLLGVVTRMLVATIIAMVICSAAGVVLAYWLAASLSKPVVELQRSAEQVSAGDLTAEISVERRDEIGLLASSFNKMVSSLRQIIGNVQEAADRVLATTSQLSAAAEETSASIEQVAASANHFSQTVSSMNSNVGQVSASTAQVVTMAAEGEAALEKTAAQMEELRRSIQELAEIIASLDTSSAEIEKIVQAISAIAEQTNLLSLNAAIEAARAGEHGRGFAVVAEEVRKLSEESSGATEEIRTLISDVQRKTQQAVEGMHRSVVNVDETARVVGDSGRLLSSIIRSINEIGQRIQNIGDDTKAIDLGAQEIAAATEEQSATVEEITSSVQGLSEMAEELQDVIASFKVRQE